MQRTLQPRQVEAFDLGPDRNGIRRRYASVLSSAGEYLCHCPGARILDVGGGAGHWADYLLASYDCHVTVLDNSRALLERNRFHPRKTLVEGDATGVTDLADGQYDMICLHLVLHHMVGDSYRESQQLGQNLLAECRALLARDGHVSVIENTYAPDRAGWLLYQLTASRVLAPLARHLGANTAGVGVLYRSDSAWRTAFAKAGFSVESSQVINTNWPRRYVRCALQLKSAETTHYWCRPG